MEEEENRVSVMISQVFFFFDNEGGVRPWISDQASFLAPCFSLLPHNQSQRYHSKSSSRS
ncbi:hypothetical protein E1A91_D13G120200v1 [Gossypium mustelinum]|uniref:Uncharacterized protein n=1 Tax=Gossypium mustelinum TaxID=34275 RepID=A0A5D2S119_GOSMU|nr:hypothetical protein E1A91_D13G120200v1 [Gossypium mustelinum]